MLFMESGDALNWFEIPVSSFGQTKNSMKASSIVNAGKYQWVIRKMGFFHYDMPAGKIGDAIFCNEQFYSPSEKSAFLFKC
jgi:hypothetical protein